LASASEEIWSYNYKKVTLMESAQSDAGKSHERRFEVVPRKPFFGRCVQLLAFFRTELSGEKYTKAKVRDIINDVPKLSAIIVMHYKYSSTVLEYNTELYK
jgi:hypothetical protein